jgi:putative chitinase
MTPQQFIAATGLAASTGWYAPVKAALIEFSIDTPAREAAWLAQIGHESGGFRFVREIWGPTEAQARYEGRKDLGNTEPGDGSRFRGRGLIQITGRANYTAAGRALGADLIRHPELLESPALAARSAGWFWSTHGCNVFADNGDFVSLTRRINGGLNGLADREKRWKTAQAALGIVVA